MLRLFRHVCHVAPIRVLPPWRIRHVASEMLRPSFCTHRVTPKMLHPSGFACFMFYLPRCARHAVPVMLGPPCCGRHVAPARVRLSGCTSHFVPVALHLSCRARHVAPRMLRSTVSTCRAALILSPATPLPSKSAWENKGGRRISRGPLRSGPSGHLRLSPNARSSATWK